MNITESDLISCVATKAQIEGFPVYKRRYTNGSPDVPHWGESGASERFNPLKRGDHLLPLILKRQHIAPQYDQRFDSWYAQGQTPASHGQQSYALAALLAYIGL